MRPYRGASDIKAAALCLLDLSLFMALLAAVVVLPGVVPKLLASLALGLAIARLFILGHDACHQSLFSSRQANRVVGRLLLLPSLTHYGLWESGHNVGHHVYANLSGYDFVWSPLSKTTYDALPRWRRALERFYRSGWGHAAYYGIEMWWKRLLFPPAAGDGSGHQAMLRDALLVWGFAGLWVVGLAAAALTTGQAVSSLLFFGALLPFAVWNLLMGATIYFHHTHPNVTWYDDIDVWQAQRDGVSNTVHITFPWRCGHLLNNIMDHPAHHLDVRIPLYHLGSAQRTVNATEAPVIQQALSWRFMRDCVNRCQLYDYRAQRWMDFDGNYTSGTGGTSDATKRVDEAA